MERKAKNTYREIFINGILYFLSFEKNPISVYLKQLRKKSDSDGITQDWYNVGNDIKNACKQYETCC